MTNEVSTIIGIPIITILLQEFMKRQSEKDKTRFEWLHREKTDALKELYKMVLDLNDFREKYQKLELDFFKSIPIEQLKNIYIDEGDYKETLSLMRNELGEKIRLFDEFCKKNQFIFSLSLVEQLKNISMKYELTVRFAKSSALTKATESISTESSIAKFIESCNRIYISNEEIIKIIERHLRKEYGSNENPALLLLLKWKEPIVYFFVMRWYRIKVKFSKTPRSGPPTKIGSC